MYTCNVWPTVSLVVSLVVSFIVSLDASLVVFDREQDPQECTTVTKAPVWIRYGSLSKHVWQIAGIVAGLKHRIHAPGVQMVFGFL